MESENIDHRRENGRPSVSPGTIKQVTQLFQKNISLNTRTASIQLDLSRLTDHEILREGLFLFLHRLQNLQDNNEVGKESGYNL